MYHNSSTENETYKKCKFAEATSLYKIEDKVLSKKPNIYTRKYRTGTMEEEVSTESQLKRTKMEKLKRKRNIGTSKDA